MRYKSKAKRSLIYLAIWGALFLFGYIRYTPSTDFWSVDVSSLLLIYVSVFGVIIQIVFWLRNKRKGEKYEYMSDEEWSYEKASQRELERTVTTGLVQGFLEGYFK